MWHLNIIIPIAMAFVGLVGLIMFLVNLLSDAIVDGTAKKGGEQLGAEVVLEQDVVGTRMTSQVSAEDLPELSAVDQKALQYTRALAQ